MTRGAGTVEPQTGMGRTTPGRARTRSAPKPSRAKDLRAWRRTNELRELKKKLARIRAAQEHLRLKQKALKDLVLFGREICGFKDLNHHLHRDVADFIASHDSVVVLLPREHLKSSLITVAYSAQQIAKNPNIRIAIYCRTQALATSFLRQIKSIIRGPVFQSYFGDRISTDFVKDTSEELEIRRDGNVREPTVYATSVGTSQTGRHFDLNIYDDIVDNTNVGTPAALERTWQWWQESLCLHDKGSRLIYVGTRWHDVDVAGRLLKDSSYKHMVRQVEEGGVCIFPEKFDKKRIALLRKRLSAFEFSCQYLNDPVPYDQQTFREEWMRDWDEELPDGLTYLTCDPALGKNKGDRSVISVVRVDPKGRIIISDLWIGHPSPSALIEIYLEMCERWQPTAAGIEANALQEYLYSWMHEKMLEDNRWYGVTPMGGRKRHKEEAILALEPFFRAGRVYFWHKCPHRADLVHEMIRWPSGRYDDTLDCLAFQLELIRYPSELKEPTPFNGNEYVRDWYRAKEDSFWQPQRQVMGLHHVKNQGGLHAPL